MRTFIAKVTYPNGGVATPLVMKCSTEAEAEALIKSHPAYEEGCEIALKDRPIEEIEYYFGKLREGSIHQPALTEWKKA